MEPTTLSQRVKQPAEGRVFYLHARFLGVPLIDVDMLTCALFWSLSPHGVRSSLRVSSSTCNAQRLLSVSVLPSLGESCLVKMSSNAEWLYIDEPNPLKTPETHHVAAYVFHLRSRWRFENLQTIVPAHWLRSLALQAEKCVHEQAMDCPLWQLSSERQTKGGQSSDNPSVKMDPSFPPSYESSESELPETRGGLALDAAMSEIFAYTGRGSGVSMSIARSLTSIPGCKLQRDPNYTRPPSVPGACPLDFALFSSPSPRGSLGNQCLDATFPKRPFVMLWMKGPAYWRYQVDARLQEASLARLRQDMASHAGPHLSNLVARWTESASHLEANPLPEWLMLFGVIHDVEYVRIVAHIPVRGRYTPPRYLSYLVDELPFGAPPFPQGGATCRKITDRLRVVLAFLVLRQHVDDLQRLLFGTETCRDEVLGGVESSSSRYSRSSARRKNPSNTSVLVSDGPEDDGSEYSTCRSSVTPCVAEPGDETARCDRSTRRSFSGVGSASGPADHSSNGHMSSCSPSTSCCSSLSSLSGDISPSSCGYSERSRNGSRWSDFMEPSTSSMYQGDFCAGEVRLPDPLHCLGTLDNGKRAEITAWTQNICSTRPPEDDPYHIALKR